MDDQMEAALAAIVTRQGLRSLSETYARAVDRRDEDLLLSVLAPEPAIEVRLPGTDEVMVQQGADAIATNIEFLRTYPSTMHMLGQSTYEVDGDTAFGEVYCLAHHLDAAHNGPSNYVMYIRYEDRYRRVDGRWLIELRRVNIDWTDRRIAST